MKINSKELLEKMKMLCPVAETRGKIPVLGYVLIEPSGDRVKLTTTNLDMFAIASVAAEDAKGEAFAVNAQTLRKIATVTDEIEIIGGDARATVVSGQTTWQIASVNKKQFPDLPKAEYGKPIEIPGDDLKRLTYLTAYAISKKLSKFTLGGAEFVFGDRLQVSATDGHRVARAWSDSIQGEGRYLIPADTLRRLSALSKGNTWQFRANENWMSFESEKIQLLAKTLKGQFPDINRIIPNNPNRATFNREILLSVFRQSIMFSEAQISTAILNIQGGKCTVSLGKHNVDSWSSEIAVECTTDIVLKVNPKYMAELLTRLDDELVTVQFKDSFVPISIENTNWLGLVMPVREA